MAAVCALGAELPASIALGAPLVKGIYDAAIGSAGSASSPAQGSQLSAKSFNPASGASSQPAAAPARLFADATNGAGERSVTGLPREPFGTGFSFNSPLPEGVYDITNPPIKQVAAEPVSTFSINVDTAYYGFARDSLMTGYKSPYWNEVRVEEMINYFPYAYPRPESAAAPLQPTITIAPSPWKPTNKLVHIGIKGYEIAAKERPRANLVFLIDVHHGWVGDRLPLLKDALRMLLDELKPEDTVGIVTYAPDSGAVLKSGFEVLKPTRVALEPTPVAERGKIADALSRLTAEGSTAGCEGLENAYKLAGTRYDKGAFNRVIMVADGDFRVKSYTEQFRRFTDSERQNGIYLSVIGIGSSYLSGVGSGSRLQSGNGIAAFVDTLKEARKVLVDEASSMLFTVAKDVKIQIEFNPAQVSEYRLIGYETRTLKREEFSDGKVGAGDMGSGHTMTAIYEVTPVAAPKSVDDLPGRNPDARPAPEAGPGGGLGVLQISYKLPGEEKPRLLSTAIGAGLELPDIQAAPEDVRFSTAVAAFGQLLRRVPHIGTYSFEDVMALARTARGTDPFGYRAEFLNLVRLANSARQ